MGISRSESGQCFIGGERMVISFLKREIGVLFADHWAVRHHEPHFGRHRIVRHGIGRSVQPGTDQSFAQLSAQVWVPVSHNISDDIDGRVHLGCGDAVLFETADAEPFHAIGGRLLEPAQILWSDVVPRWSQHMGSSELQFVELLLEFGQRSPAASADRPQRHVVQLRLDGTKMTDDVDAAIPAGSIETLRMPSTWDIRLHCSQFTVMSPAA